MPYLSLDLKTILLFYFANMIDQVSGPAGRVPNFIFVSPNLGYFHFFETGLLVVVVSVTRARDGNESLRGLLLLVKRDESLPLFC